MVKRKPPFPTKSAKPAPKAADKTKAELETMDTDTSDLQSRKPAHSVDDDSRSAVDAEPLPELDALPEALEFASQAEPEIEPFPGVLKVISHAEPVPPPPEPLPEAVELPPSIQNPIQDPALEPEPDTDPSLPPLPSEPSTETSQGTLKVISHSPPATGRKRLPILERLAQKPEQSSTRKLDAGLAPILRTK